MIAVGILLYLVGWIVGGSLLAASKGLECKSCELVSVAVVFAGMVTGASMVLVGIAVWAWENLP